MGKKHFKLPKFDSNPSILFPTLLVENDWLTIALTLNLIRHHRFKGIDNEMIEKLGRSQDKRISQMALSVIQGQQAEGKKVHYQPESRINIPHRILHLQGIRLFGDLSVSELASVALITEQVSYPTGRILIKHGDIWDKMSFIVSGEVSVMECPEGKAGPPTELGRIKAGECIGEMALFDDVPRSVSIQTTEESLFLVIHKQAFEGIMKEYPEIAISICKDLSARLRELHEKIKSLENRTQSFKLGP